LCLNAPNVLFAIKKAKNEEDLIMFTISTACFWWLFAVILACIEIESEGPDGWAYNMPTWYRTRGFVARLYGLVMSKKPLTGYHSFMFFLPVLMFHAHFFMDVAWSLEKELLSWALYFAWCPLWDYYWFVLNPHFEGKFKKEQVWWHAKSYWIFDLFPADYLGGIVLSLAFAAGASWAAGNWEPMHIHLMLLGVFFWLTAFLVTFVQYPYRRWYKKMREHDDRDQVSK